jgi:hypothetical protein
MRRDHVSRSQAQQVLHEELEVFADYNSFELTDEQAETDAFESDGWIDDLVRDQIAAAPGAVGIGTARRMSVPVTVDVLTGPPDISVEDVDQVTEASLTTSGTLVVGKLGYEPTTRFAVVPGTYRVRVYTRGVETLSENGLDGDDSYHLVLWPGEPGEPAVLKRYPGLFPGG